MLRTVGLRLRFCELVVNPNFTIGVAVSAEYFTGFGHVLPMGRGLRAVMTALRTMRAALNMPVPYAIRQSLFLNNLTVLVR